MKHLITTLIALLATALSFSQQTTTSFEGVYTGKNVYIKNPKSTRINTFCIQSVQVNGQEVDDEFESTAFSIDLSKFDLTVASALKIDIVHEDDGSPYLINPEVISSVSTAEFVDVLLSPDGSLQWTSKNESGKTPYIIEQLKWGRWVEISKVESKGQMDLNKYAVNVNLHFGENVFRIKQKDANTSHYSDKIKTTSLMEEPVQIKSTTVKKMLSFTTETAFEIVDEYGQLLVSEYGADLDISQLSKGNYYINFDNSTGVMITKK